MKPCHPPNRGLLLLAVMAGLALASCDRAGSPAEGSAAPASRAAEQPAEPPPMSPGTAAPTLEQAANLAYSGLFDGEPVTLTGGEWTGEPYVEGGASAPRAGLVQGFSLRGDLDGSGDEETVVLIWTQTGGSGTFDYLAVLDHDGAAAVHNRATVPLGDRVKLRSAAISAGTVVLETVEAGPGDAACCPGQKLRRTFALKANAMNETATEDQGRLSLADIEGDWVLTRMGRDGAVPDGIEIILTFAGETIGGKSACNRYSGSVAMGDTPGSLYLAGPLAGTRMMCPGPQMEWEDRYLHALNHLSGFSFQATHLVLTWRDDGEMGSLRFRRGSSQAGR